MSKGMICRCAYGTCKMPGHKEAIAAEAAWKRNDGTTYSDPRDRPFENEAGGRKADAGKPQLSLLPFDALETIARVMEFGAVKYGRDNWRNVEAVRYEDAMLRHYAAMQRGEFADPESGLPHAAHMACCALFLTAKAGK